MKKHVWPMIVIAVMLEIAPDIAFAHGAHAPVQGLFGSVMHVHFLGLDHSPDMAVVSLWALLAGGLAIMLAGRARALRAGGALIAVTGVVLMLI